MVTVQSTVVGKIHKKEVNCYWFIWTILQDGDTHIWPLMTVEEQLVLTLLICFFIKRLPWISHCYQWWQWDFYVCNDFTNFCLRWRVFNSFSIWFIICKNDTRYLNTCKVLQKNLIHIQLLCCMFRVNIHKIYNIIIAWTWFSNTVY